MSGGYDIGVGLSSSESSAASASGTTDSSSAQYLFGTTYGPGALVRLAGSDTPGSSGGGVGLNISTASIVGVIVAVLIFFFVIRRR